MFHTLWQAMFVCVSFCLAFARSFAPNECASALERSSLRSRRRFACSICIIRLATARLLYKAAITLSLPVLLHWLESVTGWPLQIKCYPPRSSLTPNETRVALFWVHTRLTEQTKSGVTSSQSVGSCRALCAHPQATMPIHAN